MFLFLIHHLKGIDNFDVSSVVINPNKNVRIRNRGWFVASVSLRYEYDGKIVTQAGTVLSGLEYVFKVPFSVVYQSEFGCLLEANAVAGVQILNNIRVNSDPECFDLWGKYEKLKFYI